MISRKPVTHHQALRLKNRMSVIITSVSCLSASEFNIYYDAEATRTVFYSAVTKTSLTLCATLTRSTRPTAVTPMSAGRVVKAILSGAFLVLRKKLDLEGILGPKAVAVVKCCAPVNPRDKFVKTLQDPSGGPIGILTHLCDKKGFHPCDSCYP